MKSSLPFVIASTYLRTSSASWTPSRLQSGVLHRPFQSAAQAVADCELGVLVPLYRFYPSIDSFLDTAVKRTIDQAKDNAGLKPFDIEILRVLFLIRYVDEMKGNIENLVTLCIDRIDCDRLALKKQIEESLLRLEKQSLIRRSGDNFYFLTHEEQDIKPDALWSDELEAIRAAVARLPPRLRQVVELLFGLVDGIDRTAVEVANLLGVSRQRIVQMMCRVYSLLSVDPRLLIAFEDREPPRFLIEVLRVKETGITCRRAVSPVNVDRRDLLSV